MVEWSIAAFRAAPSVQSIVVACPPGQAHDLTGDDLDVIDGGATRAHSVSNALQAVGTELVAIHDAARPLVTPALIEDTVAILFADPDAAGAIAATPLTDTVKRAVRGTHPTFSPLEVQKVGLVVDSTLDREQLWAAQTPQVFRVEALRGAFADAADATGATDEAMLVEAAGGSVLIHPSSAENLKVTTPLDLRVAELLLAERSAQ
jgi:2-C-methyl-D-erythritol 4-phosphate cytidylyltransferase